MDRKLSLLIFCMIITVFAAGVLNVSASPDIQEETVIELVTGEPEEVAMETTPEAEATAAEDNNAEETAEAEPEETAEAEDTPEPPEAPVPENPQGERLST